MSLIRIRMGLIGSTFVLGEEVELTSVHLAIVEPYVLHSVIWSQDFDTSRYHEIKSRYSDSSNSTVEFYILPKYIKPLDQSRSGCFKSCWYICFGFTMHCQVTQMNKKAHLCMIEQLLMSIRGTVSASYCKLLPVPGSACFSSFFIVRLHVKTASHGTAECISGFIPNRAKRESPQGTGLCDWSLVFSVVKSFLFCRVLWVAKWSSLEMLHRRPNQKRR